MFEHGQSPTDSKPGVRRGLSQTATTLTAKSVGDATAACLATMDSERITNPKAYETMFAVPAASKFGGLKKRSQVLQRVSGMQADDKDLSNVATLKLGNLEKISTFHSIEVSSGDQVIPIARKLSSKMCLMAPDEIQLLVMSQLSFNYSDKCLTLD